MSEIIIVSTISAASGLIGAATGIWGSLSIAKRAAKEEDRRNTRHLGIEIGKAKFEMAKELAQKMADSQGKFIPIPTYEAHLMHGLRLMELMSDTSLSASDLGKRIAESVSFTEDVTEAVRDAKK